MFYAPVFSVSISLPYEVNVFVNNLTQESLDWLLQMNIEVTELITVARN